MHQQIRMAFDLPEVVLLTDEEYAELEGDLTIIEEHDTQFAGMLLVVRGPWGLAAVEMPAPGERLVRPLANEEAAKDFVAKRLAAYERMWDGCGCNIDYFRID